MRWPRSLRYPAAMKKLPPKLVVRSETLRMLATMDLRRIVGGADSGVAACPRQDVLDSGLIACATWR